MALHIRSLKIKSFSLPRVLTRCFATQAQNSNIGDRRCVTDVDLESFTNELSSACEEARKRVSLLPYLPAASRLAVLLGESQKLVEAVNKHVLITSLCQVANPKTELSLAKQSTLSSCKVKSCKKSVHDQFLPSTVTVPGKETFEENAGITAEEKLTENVQGFGLFVQPYSYTTDDIIIRSGRLIDEVGTVGETASDSSFNTKFCLNKEKNISVEFRFQNDRLRSWPAASPATFTSASVSKHNKRLHVSQDSLLLSSLPSTSEEPGSPHTPSKPPSPQKGGPNEEQLAKFQDHISKALIRFFLDRHNYHVYHPNIVFENNYWGTNLTTNGLNAYALQLNKLRILSHIKFAHVEVQVLKCTMHPEDGTVRIRWRLKGLSQFKALMFWKFLPWKFRKSVQDESTWFDGMSIYQLDSDGLVIKHRVDRVMPDEETETVKPATLAVKLSLLLGLAPKASLNDFASLFYKRAPPNSALPQQQ